MKKLVWLVLVMRIVSGNLAGADAIPRTTRVQLDQHRAGEVQAMLAGKAEEAAEAFAGDVRLMPAYQATILGKANATRYLTAFFARFTVRAYERNQLEALALGPQVAEFGQFTMKLLHKADGKEYAVTGKYLELWRPIAAGGRLELHAAIWNYDRGPEDSELFRFAEIPAVRIATQTELPVDRTPRFEIAAFNALEEKAITEANAKLWAQFYADDAVMYANQDGIYRGRKEIGDYLADHVKHLPVFEHLDIRFDRIDDCGGYFVVYMSHSAHWRTGDYSGINMGKNVAIWRRDADGVLRTIRKIAAYD